MDPIKGYVYVIKCLVNDKQYVGITTRDVNQRFEEHIKCALKGSNNPFHRAIRKHGKHAFVVQINETCDTLPALADAERRWIQVLDTFITNGHGYNSTLGGDGVSGWRPSVEQLRIKSEGQRASPNFKRMPVIQISRTGSVIATFPTVLEASQVTGISHIYDAAIGDRTEAGGYFWVQPQAVEEVLQEIRDGKRVLKRTIHVIQQLNINDEVVNEFSSCAEASRQTGIHHIKDVLYGRRRLAGGFKWRKRMFEQT
jgi:hypothetical protein